MVPSKSMVIGWILGKTWRIFISPIFPNFYRNERFKILPQFATPIAFDGVWFRNEATYIWKVTHHSQWQLHFESKSQFSVTIFSSFFSSPPAYFTKWFWSSSGMATVLSWVSSSVTTLLVLGSPNRYFNHWLQLMINWVLITDCCWVW